MKGKKRGRSVQKKKEERQFPFLAVVTDIFVVAVLAGHFLIYDDYYYNMLETKYYYYCVCACSLLGLFAIYGIVKLICSIRGKKPLFQKRKIREMFTGTDIMVLAFAVIVIISTALSPYKWEAFWGNEGRYSGAFLLLIYVGVYFCVTRFYEIKAWHIELFLISGLLMCLLGIADYFDLDLLHFKAEIAEGQRYMFTSTIGNINTYTSCVAMVMAVAGVLFASSTGVGKNIWYGLVIAVTFAALITGMSDNAYLSMAAFFGFMPLYMFRSREGVRRYLVILAAFFSVAGVIHYVEVHYAEHVLGINSIFRMIADFSGLWLVVTGLWLLCAALYIVHFTAGKRAVVSNAAGAGAAGRDLLCKWLVRGWWCIIILVVLAVVWALWDVNVAGHAERYGGLQKFLLFDDNWGTRRGYIWRLAMRDYKEYSPLQKVFGYGPDTFGLVVWFNNMDEVRQFYGERVDSVHNEFLQYLVTIGPMGLLSYLGIIGTSIWSTVKKRLEHPIAVGAMFAVLCFNVQAAVNIHQPIATPVMWLLLCISVTPREAVGKRRFKMEGKDSRRTGKK